MPPRILIADDDEGIRALLRIILSHAGFEVVEASDGEQAFARAIDSDPTLILLDVMMPGSDGFTTCRRLKDDGRTGGVPIVFFSALSDGHHPAAMQQFGADDWIQKSTGPRELLARLRCVMDRRGIAWVT